jgi:hypothetical protein
MLKNRNYFQLKWALIIIFQSIAFQSCKTNPSLYFNQKPPNSIPELFAISQVNTENIELNVVFNAFYTEIFFSRIVDGSFVIHHSELIDGIWTPIQPIQMYSDSVLISVACDPTITKEGDSMFFLGVDPKKYSNDVSREVLYRIPPDIYMSKKIKGKWQIASKVEAPVSTKHIESYPIVVADGSLYYLSIHPKDAGGKDILRSQYLGDGLFDTPLSIGLNSVKSGGSTYVSPNEDYLISSNGKGFKIAFKKDDKWQTPFDIELPHEDNWVYYCPYMSPDENYFFFSRRYYGTQKKGWAGVTKGEVFWVSTDAIFNLK